MFRPSLLPAMAPVAAVIAIVLVLALLTSEPADTGWIWVSAGAYLGVFAVVAILVRLITLTISLDGLIYDTLVYRVHADWSNLAGVTTTVMGTRSAETIIVRHPVVEGGFWLRALPFLRGIAVLSGRLPMSIDSSKQRNLIPVSFFDKDWRSGEIGTLISHFAPQALNETSIE